MASWAGIKQSVARGWENTKSGARSGASWVGNRTRSSAAWARDSVADSKVVRDWNAASELRDHMADVRSELTREFRRDARGIARDLRDHHTDLLTQQMRNEMTAEFEKSMKPGFLYNLRMKGPTKMIREAGTRASLLALAAGAAVGLGVVALNSRSDQKKISRQELDTALVPPPMPDMAAVGGNTMMGLEPTPGDHAARVLAGRGQSLPTVDAVNPRMTAVPEDSIRNLG